MMKKRFFIFIGAVWLSLGLLAGCGAKNENGARTPDEITISGLVTQENGISGAVRQDMAGNNENICNYDWENSFCKYKKKHKKITSLLQYDQQGKKLQKFSYKEFGMEDISEISILEILDDRLLFSYYSYNNNTYDGTYDIYSVPVWHENGKEIIKFDKKQKICKNIVYTDFIYGNSSYLIFDSPDGITELCLENKEYKKIHTNPEELTLLQMPDTSITGEGNVIYFSGSIKNEYKGIFSYLPGSGTIWQVTDKDMINSIFANSGDKLFYTATSTGDGGICYDLLQYDGTNGENTTLVTKQQIINAMPAVPAENIDLIHELRYNDGYVFMEVWAKQKPYVLSCNVATKEIKVMHDTNCLVKHTEEKLEKPLSNANANYGNANDHNIFVPDNDDDISYTLKEYTLQGEFVRNVCTHYCGKVWTLLYADNKELFFSVGNEDDTEIYSVPLRLADGNYFPVISRAEKICNVDDGYGGWIWRGDFYADSAYLVYITNYHQAKVYDRKREKFINIKNMPETSFCFAIASNHIALNKIGNCFVYCSKPYGEEYAFSYYQPGTDKLTFIDKKCYTSASKACDPERHQVIYEMDDGIWCYDIKNNKKIKLLDTKDIEAFYKSHKKKNPSYDLYVEGDLLYIADTCSEFCASFNLEKNGELRYEKTFSEMIKAEGNYWASDIQQAEGKFLIRLSNDNEYEDYKYQYYDPETGTGKKLSINDKEILYFRLY